MFHGKLMLTMPLLLFAIAGCSRADIRTVKINNVMCRIKPDINSKVVEIFSQGTVLKTKPTNIQFTFMNTTDVWHEIPDKKCYSFGGLLSPPLKSNDISEKVWVIRELHKDPHGIEANDKVTFRTGQYSRAECDDIIKKFEAESSRIEKDSKEQQKREKEDCQRRGVDSQNHLGECGNYWEGTGELNLTCVQK